VPVGEGDGLGDGLGDGEGAADGDAEGLGEGDGEGLGEGVPLADARGGDAPAPDPPPIEPVPSASATASAPATRQAVPDDHVRARRSMTPRAAAQRLGMWKPDSVAMMRRSSQRSCQRPRPPQIESAPL